MKYQYKVTKNSFVLLIAFVFIIILMGVAIVGSQKNQENRSRASEQHPIPPTDTPVPQQCGNFNPCGGCGTRGCSGNDFPSCDSCGNVDCRFAPRCSEPGPTNTPGPVVPTNTPGPVVPTNTPGPVVPTNTPAPTGPTNTPAPTGPIVCPSGKPPHDNGNANCDDKISGLDYVIWMLTQCNPEGLEYCSDFRADFNGDKKVNNPDYQIWYDHSR